ncbi:hypothetical protein I656_03091 [Geobacillus sp. WSUCF1]|nr:hypothetical protein I656_03091 [Geobacillus sp. WSUCF1]
MLSFFAAFSSLLFGSGVNVPSWPKPCGLTPGAFVPRFRPPFLVIALTSALYG